MSESASPSCSLASFNEDKGSSAVPERLSVLSSKAVAHVKALTGPEMVSGGQAQRTASRLAVHHPTDVNASLGGLSCLATVSNLQPVGMAPCGLGRVIWMKTAKVMETLENKKKEEKEKYRLQLAMYRRLLLLRSIRSLHKQLEQQQARLQECYGMVIHTKKEVLKHIRSTSPSPSP
ncbi:UPF0500 protein C1orf216 homolog [Antrostomus carolinensis]|uniref:UPF0500 protein C1orf216 homolog n=1 Tax=Antrostomus carolinensis TaxID=279965 RepID=UPI0010A9884F|nr:UPF0500 protein C1orf216 homolog [Antrostomus carolinensis]